MGLEAIVTTLFHVIEKHSRLFSFTWIHSYFDLEPRAATVFSFGKGEALDQEFYKSPRLLRHASHYINMVDRAINLLGPRHHQHHHHG